MHLFYRFLFKLEKILNNQRQKTLQQKLKFCGRGVVIHPTCHVLVPQQMEVDDNTTISSYTTIYATFGVKIGKNCLISSNCGISSYNHIQLSLDRQMNKAEDVKFSKPVVIADNVWIGMNSCILPGIVIGENSIVGSGSVVTKSIPSNQIWAGNPARFIKILNFDKVNVPQHDIGNCSYLQSN